MSKGGLGKGLGAIFSQVEIPDENEGIMEIKIHDIKPNPYQPRKEFNKEEIEELSESIKEHGVIQPVVVVKEGEYYILVVGERRWRATGKAGLKKIPAVIKKKEEVKLLEMALVENIQRSNLNPVEEGEAFLQLAEEFGLKQEEIAKKVGKNRSTVANAMRLLNLPAQIKEALRKGDISSGHARAILMFETKELQLKAYKKIIEEKLSVRQAEDLAKAKELLSQKKIKKSILKTAEVISIEEDLTKTFGTKVQISHKGKKVGKGKIEISYYSIDDLNRIIDILQGGSYQRKTLEDFL